MFSRYAISQSPLAEEGTHGAIALKAFPTTVGGLQCRIVQGEFIPGDIVMGWPLNNRRALRATGTVRYFLTPAEAEANRTAA